MASIRQRIVDTVVARLDGAGKPAGLTVHRSRGIAIDQDTLPAMAVYLLAQRTQRVGGRGGPLSAHALTLRIECRVKGAIADEADVLLEPLVGWAVRALLGEPTLDGLVNSLEETQIEWAAEPADHLYAAAAVDFTAQFPTAVSDPDAFT